MLLLHPLNLASSLLLHPLNKPSSLFILFNSGQATIDLTVNLGATWVPLFGGLFQPIWSSYEVGLQNLKAYFKIQRKKSLTQQLIL